MGIAALHSTLYSIVFSVILSNCWAIARPCSSECKWETTTVKCKINYLWCVPTIPENITELKIEMTEQNVLVAYGFMSTNGSSVPNIMSLHITNSKLKNIEYNAFQGLDSLRHLYLANNKLTTSSIWPLSKLSVQTLDLRNNSIQMLPRWLLSTMENTTLNLDGNPWHCNCILGDWLRHVNGTFICETPLKVDSHSAEYKCVQPKITALSNNYPPLSIGDQISLECEATGDPAPSVQWVYPNNTRVAFRRPVDPAVTTNKAVLRIMNAQEQDRGQYQCRATSTEFDDVAVGNVTVFIIQDERATQTAFSTITNQQQSTAETKTELSTNTHQQERTTTYQPTSPTSMAPTATDRNSLPPITINYHQSTRSRTQSSSGITLGNRATGNTKTTVSDTKDVTMKYVTTGIPEMASPANDSKPPPTTTFQQPTTVLRPSNTTYRKPNTEFSLSTIDNQNQQITTRAASIQPTIIAKDTFADKITMENLLKESATQPTFSTDITDGRLQTDNLTLVTTVQSNGAKNKSKKIKIGLAIGLGTFGLFVLTVIIVTLIRTQRKPQNSISAVEKSVSN